MLENKDYIHVFTPLLSLYIYVYIYIGCKCKCCARIEDFKDEDDD